MLNVQKACWAEILFFKRENQTQTPYTLIHRNNWEKLIKKIVLVGKENLSEKYAITPTTKRVLTQFHNWIVHTHTHLNTMRKQ